eukprot:501374-Amphidinium_carterae.1
MNEVDVASKSDLSAIMITVEPIRFRNTALNPNPPHEQRSIAKRASAIVLTSGKSITIKLCCLTSQELGKNRACTTTSQSVLKDGQYGNVRLGSNSLKLLSNSQTVNAGYTLE